MDATRAFRPFEVVSDYTPSGDQPRALDQLETRLLAGESDVVPSLGPPPSTATPAHL